MPRYATQAPPLFTATAESILLDAERVLDACREAQNCIAADVLPSAATFDSVVLPLAQAENARILGARLLTFYDCVSPDGEIRAASRRARAMFDAFIVETSLREDLFALVDAVLTRYGSDESLDPESRYLLTKFHQDHVRSGLKLPAGPIRDRFRDIKERIQQLSAEFKKNVTEASTAIWLTPQELQGVPEGILRGLEKGEGENTNKLRVEFDRPAGWAARTNAKSCETRMRVEVARTNACNQNIAVFEELVALRDEAARLLGYPNHAAFRMEEKMARTPERVNTFLSDLQSRLAPAGKARIERMKQAKREEMEASGGVFDGHFFAWDEPYYDQLVPQSDEPTIGPRGAKVSEYFPLQHTVTAMLDIFQQLFGLSFVELAEAEHARLSPTRSSRWHEDVRVFTVWDTDAVDDAFLGYLFLDLYARDGKYGNHSNINIVPGFTKMDGTRQYPSTAMLCSFPTPKPEKPTLLGHFFVTLLFHEVGHGIHDLVSKTKYARFHGPDGTVVDYGEAPSQMLENWCYLPAQLKALSKHYTYLSPDYLAAWQAHEIGEEHPQPPEQIPDDLLATVLASSKPKHGALHYLRQISMCAFDMAVHQPESHEAATTMDFTELWNNLFQSICFLDDPAVLDGGASQRSRDYTVFQHLVGDYDAGYYSYLFSNVYSADMFHSAFRADPMSAREGRRYRYSVLEKGGSQDGMEILSNFLGREPSLEAFYEELGIGLEV